VPGATSWIPSQEGEWLTTHIRKIIKRISIKIQKTIIIIVSLLIEKTDPIVSQMNLVHTFLLYFHNIHFGIILPPTPISSEWSFPFRFTVAFRICNAPSEERNLLSKCYAEQLLDGNTCIYPMKQIVIRQVAQKSLCPKRRC